MCMCMAQSIECIVRNMKLNISQNRAFFIIIITAGFNLLDMYSTHRLKRWGLCKFSRQQLQRPSFQVAGANLVDINVQVSKRLPGEKISQHQCRGCSLLGILLTTLSLEAVATASVNQSSAMLPNSPVQCWVYILACLLTWERKNITWSCLFVSSSSRHFALHLSLSPSTFWHRNSSLRPRKYWKSPNVWQESPV